MPTQKGERESNVEIISPGTAVARPMQQISLLAAEVEAETTLDWKTLLRKHGRWAIVFALLGTIGGLVATVLATPQYRSRLLLEIQPVRTSNSAQAANPDRESANLQTQILMMRSGAFLKRVVGRIQVETLPVAPVRDDIFTKLRARVRPELRNSSQLMEDGINASVASLQVREVNRTNLLEIMAESIHPEIAATFVNTVGSEFVDQNLQSRSIDAQRASQWLAAQVEETKLKLQEAEEKLQAFVRSSGNLFVGQEMTLADSSLRQFQDRLTSARAERIAKQAKYELFLRSKPEQVAELIEDAALRAQQGRVKDLQQQRSVLLTKYTANHYKVQQIDKQISDMEEGLRKESAVALERIKNDYDSAVRQERLLGGAYSGAAGQVSSQATQSSQYNALKREVEMLRAAYGQILAQANEASIINALPQNNMRIVDVAVPANEPLKPSPPLNIAMGAFTGLILAGGLAYLRERADKSFKRPGSARELLSVRELGVIPSLGYSTPAAAGSFRVRISLKGRSWLKKLAKFTADGGNSELIQWQEKSFFAEGFRHVMASMSRADQHNASPQIILITSPNPAEGKTLVCSNLAIALAETGKRVLIVDADFHRPRLHAVFGLKNDVGLSDALSRLSRGETIETMEGIYETPYPGLRIFVNGPEVADLYRLLHSNVLATLLTSLREEYDVILIDAPPVLQIADVRMIDHLADGLVLVLRCDSTDRKSALDAYRCLKEDGVTMLGTILNDWRPASKRKDNYYRYVRPEAESDLPSQSKAVVRVH
jgi:capsular exopolysaccharide synthesis family protein